MSRWLFPIYTIAVLLRAWRFLSADLTGDNATTGLMGLAVLRGEFPYFFFGQNWMGGLDAILAAPIYALLGTSALTVNLLPPLISLAIMFCLQPLLRRMLGNWGMLAGLAYLAVPPTTWLFYSGEAQTHYTLGLLLCALLLLSTFKLWQAQSWKWHGPFIWGLIAGAAIWTIFSSAIVVLPCGIFLLFTGKKRLGALPIAWALAGIIIGSFPLIWFNITHGMVHFNQASVFSSRYIIPNIQSYLRNALPLILGINTPMVGRPASPDYFYETCYFLILALMAAGIFFLFRFSRGKYTPFACLLMAVLSLNIIIVLTSAYGKALGSPDQRYLLIAYLVLPFLVGASIKAAAEKRQWLGIAVLTVLALVHVSQYVGFARWDRGLLNIKSGFFFSREAKFKRTIQEIRAAGFKDIYTSQDSLKLDFLADGNPVVADYWRHRWLYSSLEVDAARNPGLMRMRQASLDLLGLKNKVWRGKIHHSFAQPTGCEVLLPRDRWQAREVGGGYLGNLLNDGDISSGFSSKGPAKNGLSVVLDLQERQKVGGLAIIPDDFRHVPKGLRIEIAGRDGKFKTIREAQNYWGPFYLSGSHPFLKARFPRIESYFPLQDVRYIRLTHLGDSHNVWTMQEILLFSPGPQTNFESWEKSADKIIGFLEKEPITRLYGDAWISAKVVKHFGQRIWAITGNVAVDNYGTIKPSPYDPLVLNPGPKTALVVTRREAPQVARDLAKWGIKHQENNFGRFVLYKLEGQKMGPDLTAQLTSPPNLQGRAGGSTNDITLEIKGGTSVGIGWLLIDNPLYKSNPMGDLTVQVSEDGRTWIVAPLVKSGPIVFSGQLLLGSSASRNLYRLAPPVKARFVKICRTAPNKTTLPQTIKVTLKEP